MTTRHPHTGSPHIAHTALEFRAVFEAATLPYALPWLLRAPRGDGHPLPEWFSYIFMGMIIATVVNILVFAENLIPVHPMDASHVVAALLPEGMGRVYVAFMQKFGFFVLLALSYFEVIGAFLLPIVKFFIRLLLPMLPVG